MRLALCYCRRASVLSRNRGTKGVDTVSRYAGTVILTIAVWVFWCLVSRRTSFVPPIEVIALFIGALGIDILRNARPSE